MDKQKLICSTIVFILVVSIAWIILYHTTGQWITVRARIVRKYSISISKVIKAGGVFVITMDFHYYFVMDNGDEVQVSYSDYVKYEVGDYFEYRKRIG